MIEKSLFFVSILSSILGFSLPETKFDYAIYKLEQKNINSVVASEIDNYLPELVRMPEVYKNAPDAGIRANNYILADLESAKILLKKGENTRVPIASTTKIMTAIVTLENYELDDVVTISAEAAYQAGADAFLRVGEEITVYELLHCLLIKSGNDSAYALAEYLNDSDEVGINKFVDKMNEKASELNMTNTKYMDPAGLDVSGYSTAHDLFLVTREALKNNLFQNIVSLEQYVARNVDNTIFHELKNSNRLVGEYKYDGAFGVKTGYMPEAGHCLVSVASRDGHILIGVVLHTYLDTVTASADESVRLLDWGFENIDWHKKDA